MNVSVVDVAEYILKKLRPVPAMKLQKLVYYSQAWSLVWDDAPLFNEDIEAWANGPVAPDLYQHHRSQYEVVTVSGEPSHLSEAQRETVDAVVNFYGDKTSQWLSDLTHQEAPWSLARKGIPAGHPSKEKITLACMAEYYGGL